MVPGKRGSVSTRGAHTLQQGLFSFAAMILYMFIRAPFSGLCIRWPVPLLDSSQTTSPNDEEQKQILTSFYVETGRVHVLIGTVICTQIPNTFQTAYSTAHKQPVSIFRTTVCCLLLCKIQVHKLNAILCV